MVGGGWGCMVIESWHIWSIFKILFKVKNEK
jgi:hypothetical protein